MQSAMVHHYLSSKILAIDPAHHNPEVLDVKHFTSGQLRLKLGSGFGQWRQRCQRDGVIDPNAPLSRMMFRMRSPSLAACATLLPLLLLALTAQAAEYVWSAVKPPAPPREFRAAWVATVNNIDWPSQRGLTTSEQKAELLGILDRAAQLRLNAVILQVRTTADAFYASSFEPWSEYLTGQMGKAPAPVYDPLSFAITEAHRRGLELHAWFNPFRASHPSGRSKVSPKHITQTRPQLVKQYGGYRWLDPGEAAAQDLALSVILDVVRRYDIDAVHLDDYFYPYPEKTIGGKWLDFPDGPSWMRYRRSGGKMARNDWRRDNINRFIARLYKAIKTEKRQVKLGISPFGIWRPGYPAPVRGLDAYEALYADARKWLREGSLDYCAPQLYWPIEPKEQGFGLLLKWWAGQNIKKRHLWPGVSVSEIGPRRMATETMRQIALLRKQAGGQIFWSMNALRSNQGGITTALLRDPYREAALSPASPWLDSQPPSAPALIPGKGTETKVEWKPAPGESVWLWVLQWRVNGKWSREILPATVTTRTLSVPDVISIAAVDRSGNMSVPTVRQLKAVPPTAKPASGRTSAVKKK
jgi:uncharacterized lipoprotein YddW (UPF0748 family)